ncbi:MAG: TonB-dependent receptor, partial [Flavobacterium sp.]
FNNTFLTRTTFANGLASAFTQDFDRKNKGVGFQGKLGADYYASEKTVFGVMIDANTVKTKLNNFSNTLINEVQSNVASSNSVLQDAYSNSPANNLTANFNIKHDFDKTGKNISFDVDYSNFNNKKDEQFNARYLNQGGQQTNTTLLRNNTDANIDIFAAKTDFTLPINKTMKFETGLKSSYVVTNNDFLSEQFLLDAWENDLGKSNNFVYKENINAAYLNFSTPLSKKISAQFGLRLENTITDGHSTGFRYNTAINRFGNFDTSFNKNYTQLFPTAYFQYKANANNNFGANLGRRVRRPNYQSLNPFINFIDRYTFSQGNPNLKPSVSNNIELSHSWKNKITTTINYTSTKDIIESVIEQKGLEAYNMPANIA